MVETVLCRDRLPFKWLFTSGNGVIVKKRSLETSVIEQRFSRVALADLRNGQKYVCIVRNTDGTIQYIDRSSFKAFLTAMTQGHIDAFSLQAYLHPKGGPGTIYRSEYMLVDQKGKFVTACVKILNYGAPDEPIQEVKSTYTRLNSELNQITRQLAGFFEQHNRGRIVKLHVEFVVDSDENIFVFYFPKVVMTNPLTAKEKAAQKEAERMRKEAILDSRRSRRPGHSRGGRRATTPSEDSNRRPSEEVTLDAMEELLGNASRNISKRTGEARKDQHSRSMPALRGGLTADPPREGFSLAATAGREVVEGKQLPDARVPFDCAGDYCSFSVQDPSSLDGSKAQQSEWLAKQLFSPDELRRLAAGMGSRGASVMGMTTNPERAAGQVAAGWRGRRRGHRQAEAHPVLVLAVQRRVLCVWGSYTPFLCTCFHSPCLSLLLLLLLLSLSPADSSSPTSPLPSPPS